MHDTDRLMRKNGINFLRKHFTELEFKHKTHSSLVGPTRTGHGRVWPRPQFVDA